MRFFLRAALTALLFSVVATAFGAEEDGYDLWLRYRPLERAAQQRVQAQARSIVLPGAPSPTTDAALSELNYESAGALFAKLGIKR